MTQSSPEILLRAGTLIDGTGAAPVPADLRVRDGLITEIGDGLAASADTTVIIDVGGRVIVPGLIDCEVHLVLAGEPGGVIDPAEPLSVTTLRAALNARRTVEAGITTIRDLGGREYVEFSLREFVESGVFPGPRLLLCGKILSITGSGAAAFPGMYREADGADEVRKAAREQLRVGADFIKLMATGAALAGEDPGPPQFTIDEISAAADEAHRFGNPLVAHAHSAEGVRNALAGGADVIGHGTFLHQAPDAIERMASDGVYLVPTLSLWRGILDLGVDGGVPAPVVDKARRALEHHSRSFECALEAGVRIAMGTDAGTPYNLHGENAREIELMVQAGMTPAQALEATTRIASECLGLADSIGTLAPGKVADLLVVDGNPLENVACLREAVVAVMHRGNFARCDMHNGRQSP